MMENNLFFRAALALTCLAGMHDARCEVRLPAHLSSNAVLQRDVPARISGWADPGEPVVVKLGNQVVGNAVGAGPQKQWTLTLPVLKAGPIADITIEGKNSIILSNLLAGDVWVCSGQSNMAMSLQAGPWCSYGGVTNAEREVAEANHPQIRLFTGRTPWVVCSPESAKSFSAIGYFFGRDLEQNLRVPIGLIQAAVGGVMAEYFTPREAREARPGFAANFEESRRIQGELGPLDEAEKRSREQWLKEIEEATQKGLPRPPAPPSRLTPEQKIELRDARYTVTTGTGYDHRIRPLTTQPIKGVIWYQGEGNAGTKANYAELLTQLIGGWRHDWNQGDFPFLIMQLANYDYHPAPHLEGKATFAEVRAAQEKVSERVPNCGMATCIDIGEAKNIHPKNKQEAGHRLALVALKQVYGQDVVASGPRLVGTQFEGAKVKLSFDPGGKDQRLVFKRADLSGFELAAKDGAFVPALTVVSGTTLTLSAPSLDNPCSVRYAWADNPIATLFNSAGLPALPFQQTSATAAGAGVEGTLAPSVSTPASFALRGEWKNGTLRGHREYAASLYTNDAQATAVWRPNLQSASPVRVAFYLVTHPGNTSGAQVEITGSVSPLTTRIDLATGEPRWETVGVVQFQGRGEEQITLSNAAKGALRLSAVRLEILDPADPAMVWQTLILDDTIPTSLKDWIVPAPAFADVRDSLVQLAAGALVADGLLAAPAQNAFAPEQPMARDEFVAALRKLAGGTWDSAAKGPSPALSISEAYALTLAAARATGKNLDWAGLAGNFPKLPQWAIALGLVGKVPLSDATLARGQGALLLRRFQQEVVQSGPPPGRGEWELTFHDEFTGDKLEPAVWNVANGAGGKLLGGRWPENCVVENGLFRLVTRQENRGGKAWSSGMAGTKVFRQRYGYWEARYRYAGAPGLNNAFWTNPGPGKGFEIDFNEGHWPNTVNMTLHQKTGSMSKSWRAPQDLSRDFHTYAVLWNEQEVIYYWDGQEVDRKANRGAHLESPVIFSTAVFTWAGPVTPALDGKSMDVDWVRVYRLKSTSASVDAEVLRHQPTNATEEATRQSVVDAEIEAKYRFLVSTLPAAAAGMGTRAARQPGAFYLPHHKREKWLANPPPPTTYEVDGRQFVVIAATGGGKLGGPTGDAWVAFALPELK